MGKFSPPPLSYWVIVRRVLCPNGCLLFYSPCRTSREITGEIWGDRIAGEELDKFDLRKEENYWDLIRVLVSARDLTGITPRTVRRLLENFATPLPILVRFMPIKKIFIFLEKVVPFAFGSSIILMCEGPTPDTKPSHNAFSFPRPTDQPSGGFYFYFVRGKDWIIRH